MKRHLIISGFAGSIIAVCSVAVSCQGNQGGTELDPTLSSIYYIEADKTAVEADGKDAVTFRVVDGNGTDLSATEANYINIVDETTGNRLDDHAHIWTSVKNGEFTFSATYRGHATENTVKVTASGRAKYEKYIKTVAMFDITNTQCPNCPYMTNALENVPSEWKQHMEIMAIHGAYNADDPYILGNVGSNLLNRYVGQPAYPSCIINLDEHVTGGGVSSSEYAALIEDQLRNHPATCGVAIDAATIETTSDGSKLTVNARITSSTGGTYDLGYAFLIDNQPGLHYYSGTTLNDIVLAISSNYMSIDNSSTIVLGADEEASDSHEFEFSGDISDYADDARVVVFALAPNGSASIIDNLAVCAIGSDTDYRLND